MNRKKMVCASIVIVAVGIACVGWKLTARGAYESAEYAVLESDGKFEIREYSDLTMATTNMQSQSQGGDDSFMRLFRYIGGANHLEREVAMTTPVFMQPESENMPGQMGFVVPKSLAGEDIPVPTNNAVDLNKRVGGSFAVIRFDGHMDAESVVRAEGDLREWINAKGLVPDGNIEFAGYDPPWTPGVFRRNEVLIRIPKPTAVSSR